jgi:hypothetical protein
MQLDQLPIDLNPEPQTLNNHLMHYINRQLHPCRVHNQQQCTRPSLRSITCSQAHSCAPRSPPFYPPPPRRHHTHIHRLNKQMGFSALEYGVGSGLYFLGYGLGIVPSTFATIRYGARRWLGVMTILCGVLGMAHALIHNRTSFFVLRCFLGLIEAGTGSSAGHLLAQFYPKSRWGHCGVAARRGGVSSWQQCMQLYEGPPSQRQAC